MGCGSSSHVVTPAAEPQDMKSTNGVVATNGHGTTDHGRDHDKYEDLPTVVLPDTPAKPKPPIAFDISVEELGARQIRSPPPHLQRLLQPPQPDITLPDIQEKLAEAEIRRQMILQQRAASAQKRSQKMMKSLHEMDRLDSEHETMEPENKHGSNNTLKIPPEPSAWADRNI